MAAPTSPLRALFFLRAVNFDRIFEGFLRELLERGHRCDVVFDTEKQGLPAHAMALFDALRAEYPGLTTQTLAPRIEPWLERATHLRFALDYLRYLEPEYAGAEALRQRARVRVSRGRRAVIDAAHRLSPAARRHLGSRLRDAERRLPVSEDLRAFIREHSPDVVLVAPLVGLGAAQGDYLRAAEAEGIPTILPVASWDNLTNKGVLREAPTLTIVWNEAQVEEAVRLHAVPRERVYASGAHTYDHWFDWRPSVDAPAFAEQIGLDPGRPFVLYVCSSKFIAGDEHGFIEEWLGALRSSDDPRLRDLGVLVRPHPQNVRFWEEHDVSEPGRVVVWPRAGAAPTDAGRKTDYFHSLHHASAVVGVNTSALIEAAIVRKPVLTLVHDRFRETQGGTLHFAHIAGDDGLLVVAGSWDEHRAQLLAVLDDPDLHRARIEGFLRRFVRPHGLGQPAGPLAIDALERTARQGAQRPSAASLS